MPNLYTRPTPKVVLRQGNSQFHNVQRITWALMAIVVKEKSSHRHPSGPNNGTARRKSPISTLVSRIGWTILV